MTLLPARRSSMILLPTSRSEERRVGKECRPRRVPHPQKDVELDKDEEGVFFFSGGRRHRSLVSDWSSDVCSSDRVHEDLVEGGAVLSYAALTAFCRRHGLGYAPPTPAGRYDFAPGEEIQHDTSPHELELAGKKRKVQTASAVLCYSRMLFFQCYPNFRRFDFKVFLTEALRFMCGAIQIGRAA